jgi:hypothetical protein
MIHDLTDKTFIPQLVKMAGELTPTPTRALHKMLAATLGSIHTKVIVDESCSEIQAYIFASIEIYNGEDAGFIQVACAQPQSKSMPTLLQMVEDWCKGQGLKDIYFICYRNPEPFIRKYKFQSHAYILKKEM